MKQGISTDAFAASSYDAGMDARYRAIFEHSGQGILIVDRDFRIKTANEAFLRLMGYSKEDLPNIRYYDLLSPGELERQSIQFDAVLTGEPVHLYRVMRRRDGKDIAVEVSIRRVSQDEAVFVLWDMTETTRHERELRIERERLLTLLDAVPAPVWALRADHSLAFSNAAYRELLAPREADACHLGHDMPKAPCSQCPLRHVLDGKAGVDMEWALPDGRIYLVKAVRFQDIDGSSLAVGLGVDITAKKAMERKLASEGAAAQAATKAKSTFLASMSHEIRTPLNGVLGHLQLLQESGLSEYQSESAQAALGSGRLLMRLIDDIMDLSKIEAGAIDIAEAPFHTKDVLHHVLSLMAPQAKGKGLNLFCLGAPATVVGDAARIQQIALNLCGNAVKYTHKGFVRLVLNVTDPPLGGNAPAVSGKSAVLTLTVADTGPGIPAGRLAEAFEPYTRLEATPDPAGGAGLGLAIVKRLVDALGGQISLESAEDRGTVVTVRLPVARYDGDRLPGQQTAQARPTATGLRVLVAEDERINQRMMQKALERRGHVAILASNGAEALELLRAHGADVVLMDVNMPVMDGLEAVRAIRRGEAGEAARMIPVAALTAQVMQGDKEECLRAGMNLQIAKPVELGELDRFLACVASREAQCLAAFAPNA